MVEYPTGKPDDFKVASLSSPHNARVDKEAQRIHSEHPGEPESVLNGRVLGALAVTRGKRLIIEIELSQSLNDGPGTDANSSVLF